MSEPSRAAAQTIFTPKRKSEFLDSPIAGFEVGDLFKQRRRPNMSTVRRVGSRNPYLKLLVYLSPSKRSNKHHHSKAETLVKLPHVKKKQNPPNCLVKHVSMRQAMRNSEILRKVRNCVNTELCAALRRSNGVKTPAPSARRFTVCIGKGNNAALVRRCFASRPWWCETAATQSCDLLWTQLLDLDFIGGLAVVESKPAVLDDQCAGRSLECRFQQSSATVNVVNISSLNYDSITKSTSYAAFADSQEYVAFRTHNRLEGMFNLADKKHLYYNMRTYYDALNENVFEALPLTFHIKGSDDPAVDDLREMHRQLKAVWIVKPAENCNRGNGIFVTDDLAVIEQQLETNPYPQTGDHTFIVQQYMTKPFLIYRRKFDIRCFALVTSINGILQAYFYQEGYLRTSSKEYVAGQFADKFVHLTNDAVQKRCELYGRHERGNKLSFSEFQRYLDHKQVQVNFLTEVLPKIKTLVTDTIQATYMKLDKSCHLHTFEVTLRQVLGYDFLLDSRLKPWLIEVNTNPCLELSSPLLAQIIPAMLENAFQIAVDPYFPSHCEATNLHSNKFELIFHETVNGLQLNKQMQ